MAIDLKVFDRIRTKQDFDRLNQEFELKKQLMQSEITKNKQLDLDKLGEQVLIKQAAGEPLTPEDVAIGIAWDAKRQTIATNPVTGVMYQNKKAFESLGGVTNKQSSPMTNMELDVQQQKPKINKNYGLELPINTGLNPKAKQDLMKATIEADRKRLDEIIGQASTSREASQAAQIMKSLQPELGYTGFGGGALGAADKALTSMGMGGMIAGTPQARENFEAQGVQAWVRAVEPLKGALTELEGARFDRAVSNLETTPEGIQSRAEIAKVLSDRAQEKSQFYEQYYNQNGTLNGADAIWQDYAEKNPVITDEFLLSIGLSSSEKPTNFREGLTATNPQTGEKMIFSKGKWRKF